MGKFDFDNMKATDNEKVIPLTIPDGITVLGDVREVKDRLQAEQRLLQNYGLDTGDGVEGGTWSSRTSPRAAA
ncbi:MAG: hypothetical protein ACLU9S_08995 [Oscillospiraceae bacterium]